MPLRGKSTAVGLFILVGIAVVLAFQVATPGPPQEVRTSLSVAEALAGGEAGGFARALEVREFGFPQDHGSHPDFRTEWWYVTGNLEGPQGEPYGFQFTLFRSSVSPEEPRSPSPWATPRRTDAAVLVVVTKTSPSSPIGPPPSFLDR